MILTTLIDDLDDLITGDNGDPAAGGVLIETSAGNLPAYPPAWNVTSVWLPHGPVTSNQISGGDYLVLLEAMRSEHSGSGDFSALVVFATESARAQAVTSLSWDGTNVIIHTS